MTDLRVATLNLLNFAAPPLACYEWDNIYTEAQWQQKTNWLKNLLQQQQPDVLALQEVFSVDALQQLLSPLGYHWFATVETPVLVDDHVFTKPVVAIASRYPILSTETIPASPAALQQLGLASFQFSRCPLLVQIQTPQFGPLFVATVHLKSRRPA
jgi:endonuclease/exonuclease/phosphatase family metal-dependent hydrolase